MMSEDESPKESEPEAMTQQLCCVACGYKCGGNVQQTQDCSRAAKQGESGENVLDCSMASKQHSWAGDHTCSSSSLRCSSWVSGQIQVWAGTRKEDTDSLNSLTESDISSQGPNKGPKTPDLSEFLQGIDPQINGVGTPTISKMCQLQLSHWDLPRHQKARLSLHLDSQSPNSTQSATEMLGTSEMCRQTVQSDSVEQSFDHLVLDNTEILVMRPVNCEINLDSHLDDTCYRDESLNYTPAEMTFCKRKFNSSHGSDQSSSNQAPVAKRGKLEKKVVKLPGSVGLDKTWKLEEGKGLDCTWLPGTFPSDCDDSEDSGDDEDGEDIPLVCTNCTDGKPPVAWCRQCEDPYLCDPCVWAHRRVTVTKQHQILLKLQSHQSHKVNQDHIDEDPLEIFENILNCIHPGRKNSQVSSGSQTHFDGEPDIPDLASEVRLIRQNSSSLVNCLNKSSSLEGGSSDTGYPCADSRAGGLGCHDIKMPRVFSRSNSQSSSNRGTYKPTNTRAYSVSSSDSESSDCGRNVSPLTERMIADNLLPILNVHSDEVKMKAAVVIEILAKNDVVNPAVFCDQRCIEGFKSLLATKDRRLLGTALTALDHFISAVGRKGIFFGLVKIEAGLGEILKTMQNQADIKDAVTSILNRLDRLLGH